MRPAGDENGLDQSRLPVTPTELATAIHATPHKMVMAFAGAGTQALAWLHSVGGSSRTGSPRSTSTRPPACTTCGGSCPPGSPHSVARAMARSRALAAAYANPADAVFGLASTATIATDRAKRGEHRVAAAVDDAFGTVTYHLTPRERRPRPPRRGRDREPPAPARRRRRVRVLARPELPLVANEHVDTTFMASDLLASLEVGQRDLVVMRPDGALVSAPPAPRHVVLSGAFNPLHRGHLEMAAAAARHVNLPALFELPMMNADKAPIGLLEARRRAQQFAGRGHVALTNAALFVDKAALFPSVFVVGVDTAERILEPRFYGGAEQRTAALQAFAATAAASWWPAGSTNKRVTRPCATLSSPRLRAPVHGAAEGMFRRDVSSTEIRARWVEGLS